MQRKVGSAFFYGLIAGLSPFLLLAHGSDQVQAPGKDYFIHQAVNGSESDLMAFLTRPGTIE
jgi:hypothetical protein